MTYTMYRVFGAIPSDLELESRTFHDTIGQINEEEAMANGLLFVPVTILPNMVDTRFFHNVIVENIEDSTFFVQILDKTWGPPERNFEWKYDLACKLKSDSGSRLQDVAIFFKEQEGQQVDPVVLDFKASMRESTSSYCFENIAQFKEQLRSQLSVWQRSLVARSKAS